MTTRRVAVLTVMIVCVGGVAMAQEDELPLRNWGAPPYWTPPAVERESGEVMAAHELTMPAQAQALPSSPLPFVAIAPCRIVDTRVAVSDGFHQPNFADNEARTFTVPSSTDCPGLPAGAGAWSLNIQFRPLTQLAFLTAYPTGTTRPGVSTMTAGPAAWVQNAAVVPAGTGGGIDVYCQFAGRVVIDINGYYGPQSVVTSLNTLNGALTLAPGSNIAITPSAGTLTIAMTGVPGGTLPAGTAGQTLYSNGAGWLASSALTNNGTNVGVSGRLVLANTAATSGTPTAGVLYLGAAPFLHDYANPGSDGFNTFLGQYAGNFTIGGGNFSDGSYITAVGTNALNANTTGSRNTAVGAMSLINNTVGSYNTATGDQSLAFNTTGGSNTASGALSLLSNTIGESNTAAGANSLRFNTTAGRNTAIGSNALYTQSFDNTGTPWDSLNTAVGDSALYSNQPTTTSNGVFNTALGAAALYSNTTGNYNTATGYQSLYSDTIGSGNTATGALSLHSDTQGSFNTAIGISALSANSIGAYNTATGFQTMEGNTTGNLNTAVGAFALLAQSFDNAGATWDSANTAVGFSALRSNQPTSTSDGFRNSAIGSQSLYANTTGWQNTATGFSALYAVTTGWENTAIGANAGNRSDTILAYGSGNATFVPTTTGSYNTFLGHGTGATVQASNCTAVGIDAYCDGDNEVRLGNVFVSSIGGEVPWSALSDIRAKTDVRDVSLGLDFVMALRPVEYRLRSGNGKTDMGFVAQDIEALLGDGYNVLDVGGDPERTLSLRHTDLIAPLVKAIQEQQEAVASRDRRIAALEHELDAQRTQIEELRRQVKSVLAMSRVSTASTPAPR